jgi:lipoyl(octanoyl) transferase
VTNGEDRRSGWLIRPPQLVPYELAYGWMHDLADARLRGAVPDLLILLEHPPVYTVGRMGKPHHVLWDAGALAAAGAELRQVDRGGSATFHGPGQLVGYPILDLGPGGDVLVHLRRLEDVIIRTCADLGVQAERDPAGTGVWAGEAKVCAIGVRVKRARVTLHGFALNCTTDLSWFDGIVPCGIPGRDVTTLTRLAGREIAVGDAQPVLVRNFAADFGISLGEPPARAVPLPGAELAPV